MMLSMYTPFGRPRPRLPSFRGWFGIFCSVMMAAGPAPAEDPAAPGPAAGMTPAGDSMLSGTHASQWVVSTEGDRTSGWLFQNGVLMANPIGEDEPDEALDLDWPEPVGDFELAFEFQVLRMGWGGIEYRRPESPGTGRPLRGLIFCICDDAHHPLPRVGRLGNRSTGSLYDVLGPSPSSVVRPLGEWNQARIVAQGSKIEHWINGMRVLRSDTARPEFEALAAGSIFRDTPQYGRTPIGGLRLLRGDGRIAYRNMIFRTPDTAAAGDSDADSPAPVPAPAP